MAIYESGENYLEAILQLELAKGSVHSVDIAAELGFTKPSVSRAMSVLKRMQYITMDKSGEIHLTEEGRKVAVSMYERHKFLTEYLIRLGVSPDVAEQDACRMEHALSQESFDRIRDSVDKK